MTTNFAVCHLLPFNHYIPTFHHHRGVGFCLQVLRISDLDTNQIYLLDVLLQPFGV
ncbi:hypothetical protein BDZ91DRAFT_711659 [Kalaharituber pfeilii]|nr:hypothetical protein BDZ91DRAFT_711659 [Kalaharituber pfeilii]